MLSVVVLSLTPLNDLLMASPETRARSRAPHSLAIRIAFTRDSLAPDAAIATGSLAVHPAMTPERNLSRAPYCISQSCCNASSRPLCHTHPQRFQGRKQGPDFQKIFISRLGSKFATNLCLNIPPRFKHVATLPCEI